MISTRFLIKRNGIRPPVTPTGGQKFNVYNLDPYVWFVHRVEEMSAYGFSIDDDVSNPTATGPLLGPNSDSNHYPNNLQIGFGGTHGLGNQSQWFPTIPWGTLEATATISVFHMVGNEYDGRWIVTFTGPDGTQGLQSNQQSRHRASWSVYLGPRLYQTGNDAHP